MVAMDRGPSPCQGASVGRRFPMFTWPRSTQAMTASCPRLSPSWPRDEVSPPRNCNVPSAPYSSVSPEVDAPKRRASTASRSRTIDAPATLRDSSYNEVCSQSASACSKSKNTMSIAARLPSRSAMRLGSTTLARVYAQCGWTNMSSVGRSTQRTNFDAAGQAAATSLSSAERNSSRIDMPTRPPARTTTARTAASCCVGT
jgi:hypothetical protein